MSNTNYNQKTEFDKINEYFCENNSLSMTDLIIGSITDVKLKLCNTKALPSSNLKNEWLKEKLKIKKIENPKLQNMRTATDALLQIAINEKLDTHYLNSNHNDKVYSISQNYIRDHFKKYNVGLDNQEIDKITDLFFTLVQKSCYQKTATYLEKKNYQSKSQKELSALQNLQQSKQQLNLNTTVINQSINQLSTITSGIHEPTTHFEGKKQYTSFSAGYILNPDVINEYLNLDKMDNSVNSKVNRLYTILKGAMEKGANVYTFNNSDDLILDFGPQRKITVKGQQLNLDNIDNLITGDLVFNLIDFTGFEINKIVDRLKQFSQKINKDVQKKRCSLSKFQNLKLQIDLLLQMFEVIEETGYYIDIYKVGEKEGRLYAMGITFQNISKVLRKIIFHGFTEVDQKAAQPQIIHDLSDEGEDKEILGQYLQNQNEFHEIIKMECGLGKKAFKKRRSCAVRGKIFHNDKMVRDSQLAKTVLTAIKNLVSKLQFSQIIKEERRRTMELIGQNTLLVWLHDGAIIKN
jgi:hypothetical protein